MHVGVCNVAGIYARTSNALDFPLRDAGAWYVGHLGTQLLMDEEGNFHFPFYFFAMLILELVLWRIHTMTWKCFLSCFLIFINILTCSKRFLARFLFALY